MAIKTDTFTGGGGGGGAVTSVNTQTGAVVLSGNDLVADHTAVNYTAANANVDGHFSGIDTKLGTIASGLTYKGAFNATAGTPSIANALQGDLYIIDTAGTIYGQTWAIGDHLLINADMGGSITNSKIDKIDNTEPTNVLITTNNLSDLDNATTARTNLGLGNVATLDTGVSNGNVIVADATGLPAIDGSQLTGVTSTDSTKLAIANNLSDLNNAGTARTNLGLGNVATLTTGVANGNVIIADATGLPIIDGSQLTGITSTDSTKLAILNNLSDLNNAVTARTNLGLGNVATLDTGVANGNVIVADATGLPVIDGSQLTGVTSTDTSKLAIANNLSDLNNATTARTNLGLGNVATLTTGVSNGNVIVADATGLPAIDGSQLTGVTSTDSTKLAIANNLSDLNNAVTARTNLGLGTASTAASTDFLSGTGADTLGGDLDVGSSDIISSSNANIELAPNGTGKVTIKGNATSGSGQIVLNCEQNSHGISLKGPPHSAAASYTLTFPDTDGTADQVLKTDGSGGLDWVDQASGGGGFTYSAITADPANAQANYHYSCGAGNQTFTVTLPTSGVSAGSEIRIKNMGTGDITIDPQTQTIDGVTTDYVLDVQYSAITLVSTGSNWEII